MKRLVTALCALLLAVELHAQTTTPNLGLTLPPAQAGSWGAVYNNNFLIIDSAGVGGVGGAPLDLDYLTRSASGLVSGERVVTDTPTISWDWSTAGQAKAGVVAGALGPTQINQAGAFAFTNTVFPVTTIAALGSASTPNTFKIVTDATGASCTVAGGSTRTLCLSDGAVWNPIGSGVEIDTLATVCARGCSFTGANSFATGLHIGESATVGYRFYSHPTNGPTISCVVGGVENDCDHIINIAAGKNLIIKFAGTEAEQITAAGVHTYSGAGKPRKSVWFGAGALSTDGTFCGVPAEVTINSGPKLWTIICTDNDASTIYGSAKLPDSYDGGTLTFEHVYIQTAADTSALNGDIACQIRANGEAPSSTWGTEIAIDDAAVTGSNKNDKTVSAAVTCSGTPAAGNMLYFRYQLDAAGTTTAVATLHHVGFNVEYTAGSRSD